MKNRFLSFFLAVFFIMSACIWFVVSTSHTGQLRISFLQTSGAGAILITSPTGNHILIDTGSDASILTELGKSMLFYEHSIDMIITTEPNTAHIGALPMVFSRYRVGAYASENKGTDSAAYRTSMNEVRDSHIPTHFLSQGDHIDIGGGAYVFVLFAGNHANEPLVLELKYKKTRIIFAGTMTLDMQSLLAPSFHDGFENGFVAFSSSTRVLPSLISSLGQMYIFRIGSSGGKTENFVSDDVLFTED